MTCREIADFLVDYVSGELPADVQVRFERHLSLCPNCQAYVATYRAAIDMSQKAFAVRDAEREVPEELVKAILDSLRR